MYDVLGSFVDLANDGAKAKIEIKKLQREIKQLQSENERYRKTLEKIANYWHDTILQSNEGRIAHDALQSTEQGKRACSKCRYFKTCASSLKNYPCEDYDENKIIKQAEKND